MITHSSLMRKFLSKSMRIVFMISVVFQSNGLNAVAAPTEPSDRLQEGGNLQALTCGINTSTPAPTYCDIQIVLMMDDSGSMRTNDTNGIRNQGAKNLVDILAQEYYLPSVLAKADNHNLRLPVINVAVIHFSENVRVNSGWIAINPASLNEWEKQRAILYDFIDWRNDYKTMQYTNFVEPFETAAKLLTSNNLQGEEGNCTRKSILLFTDGTPENRLGILQEKKLEEEMVRIRSITQNNLPDVNIYVTGFKVNRKYWNNDVDKLWSDIVGSPLPGNPLPQVLFEGKDSLVQVASRMEEITAFLIDVQSVPLHSDKQNPQKYSIEIPKHIQSLRLTLYNLDPDATLLITDPNGNEMKVFPDKVTLSGAESSVEVWQLATPIAGSYKIQTTKPGGIITGLLTYQNLSVVLYEGASPFQQFETSDIKFKLVDDSGNVVLPGDDSAYTLNLNISVKQGNQDTPLYWSLNDEFYQVTWTPMGTEDGQFKVNAEYIGVNADILLNCEGTTDLTVETAQTEEDNELAEKFAPLLKFDSKASEYGYPSSAGAYYQKVYLDRVPVQPEPLPWSCSIIRVVDNVIFEEPYSCEKQLANLEALDNLNLETIKRNEIPTYFKVLKNPDGGFGSGQVRIMYWWFYAYQRTCFLGWGSHATDWERVMVTLTEDRSDIAAVTFWQHGGWYTRIKGPHYKQCNPIGTGRCGGNRGFEKYGDHPVVYVERVAHGSNHESNSYGPGGCGYWEGFRSGTGGEMETWNNLVPLDPTRAPEQEKAWMIEDGDTGVGWINNPMKNPPTWEMPACEGSSTWLAGTSGCYKSEGWAGDQQEAWTILKKCEPNYTNDGWTCREKLETYAKWLWDRCKSGYTDWGLFCGKGGKIYGRFSSGKHYDYNYIIPSSDLGLARERRTLYNSLYEWNLP